MTRRRSARRDPELTGLAPVEPWPPAIPQRMPYVGPHNNTPFRWNPPVSGPRFSSNPRNPLDLKGHEDFYMTEKYLSQMEAAGFVVLKPSDINILHDIGTVLELAYAQHHGNPRIRACLSVLAAAAGLTE